MKRAAGAVDLTSAIQELKEGHARIRARAEELRTELRDLSRRPLSRGDIIEAARAELEQREQKALQKIITGQFSRTGSSNNRTFFPLNIQWSPHGLEQLFEYFLLAGGGAAILDRIAAEADQAGAISAEEKTRELERLQGELDNVERQGERMRMELAEFGLRCAPDPKISAANFLFENGERKLRELEHQCQELSSVINGYSEKNQQLSPALTHHFHNVQKLSHMRGAADEEQTERAKLKHVEAERQELMNKMNAAQAERNLIVAILNRCREFLKEHKL